MGHTASVVCLVAAKNTLEMECIVSSSENGFDNFMCNTFETIFILQFIHDYFREMCTWDLIDGQCIESVKLYQIHSHIQVSNLKQLV